MIKKTLSFLTLTAFLSALIVLSLASTANSQTEQQGARFTKVVYNAKIHVGTSDTWTFTIYNLNCSENDQGAARFFLEFYKDNELWLDEYNSTQYRTWPCNKSSAVSHNYRIDPWTGTRPASHDMRIKLYWYNNGTARLEDTTSFTVAVTIHIPLQHIFATGYLIAYLLAFFLLLSYNYVEGLEE